MAHQDDEFGVFHQIRRESASGRNVYCIYATDGAASGTPDKRERESLAVLTRLGVSNHNIIFLGRQLSIGDNNLYCHANLLAKWLHDWVTVHADLRECFVPAWEGGHPDHDLLHAIVDLVLLARSDPPTVWHYPI